ncbi:MAG: cyclic nucleotide-binding domain-containing protein [Desulforhopalus sp.]|nr:cyclic nucleotide-binding domain-containing protein [Desulforhopalus sp.]
MENKPGSPKEILEIVKKSISLSEEKRRQQRFEYNLTQLANNNIQVLKNVEFVQGIIEYLLQRDEHERMFKQKLLAILNHAVISEDTSIRERTLAVLSMACENFMRYGMKDETLLVAHSFSNWLGFEKEVLPGLVVVIKRIEELTAWLLENSFWKEAEEMLSLFLRIHSGGLAKGAAFRSVIPKNLNKFATKATLERLIDGYLFEDDNQTLFQDILLHFETRGVTYLLNRVIQSLSREERITLINFIPIFGEAAFPILEEYLQKRPPWMVVRNILYILGEIRIDSCYSFTQHCFSHEDKRVQLEMISCVVKIGGGEMVDRLLDGLERVDDDLKGHIIQFLVENFGSNKKVFAALCRVTDGRNILSTRSKSRLVGAVVAALRSFPCNKSIEILLRLQSEYGKSPGSEQILQQIDEALKAIGPQLRHSQQVRGDTTEGISFDDDPQEKRKALSKLAGIEENLRKLVRDGNISVASKLLKDQALAATKDGDFMVAEKLRDRLLEINPMALNDAVELGDIIEEARATPLASHHLEIWSELYEEMTTDQFNALYAVLRREEYRKGDMIVRAGETDNVLYLVNSGYVSMNCMAGGNEKFLKRMGGGSILGGDLFFSSSVWTVTIRAISDVSLQVLHQDVYLKVIKKFPEIEIKLNGYCRKYEIIPQLLKMSGEDRREYPRVPVAFFTQNVLLDPYGNKGKRRLTGELKDISLSGLAFILKISSKHNAKLLLGRQIESIVQGPSGEILTECNGVIVGVKCKDVSVDDFTVHVKLSQRINASVFDNLINRAKNSRGKADKSGPRG